MASLRARHSRKCALTVAKLERVRVERGDDAVRTASVAETPAPKEGSKIAGCTCKPTFTIRGGGGTSHEKVGRVLRDAQRQQVKVSEQVEDGTYVAPKNELFRDWGTRWRTELLSRPKPGTVEGYRSSIDYGIEAFGDKRVRSITVDDIDRLVMLMASKKTPGGRPLCSPSTQAKHLRVLSACFDSAVRRRLAAVNPIALSDNRPRGVRPESAYFEDGEIAPLVGALTDEGFERTFKVMAMVAVTTGMRHGELAALTFGDIDFTESEIRVRRSVRKGVLSETKNRQARTVDMTTQTAKILAAWWADLGKPGDEALVFPDEKGGHLADTRALYRLEKAMKTAGIKRAGLTGSDRDWHSLRHTYARVSLQNGMSMFALSRQLGHSSQAVTDGHYAHWARAAAKEEARKLEGAFPL